MSLRSTVGTAKAGTKSVRSTIPEGIVVFLGIEVGDRLEWRMETTGEERIVVVRKVEEKAG